MEKPYFSMNNYLPMWDNTAFPGPVDPFSVPMSFRDFLRLKKEVLEVYEAWSKEAITGYVWVEGDEPDAVRKEYTIDPNIPWPEALEGLTREDIEILKM